MTYVEWREIDRRWCDRAEKDASFEVKLVYPANILPDQPPRVIARRCSRALECNQLDRAACVWAGTLPGYDPFAR